MSQSRIFARNLLVNWVGVAVSLAVMFFLSPFLVHTLGMVEYGVWSLLTVLTGYMGLFDLGVRSSTGRYIILYLGKGDHRRLDETVRTGLGFFSALSGLVVLAGLGLGIGFPSFFAGVPDKYSGLVVLLLPMLAVNVWLTAVAAVFASVLAAHDRFDLIQGINVGVLLTRAGAMVLTLLAGHGIVGLTVVTVAAGVLATWGNWVLAKRVYPRLRVWPLVLSRDRLRELFAFGIAAFLASAAYRVMNQTDQIVAAAAIGVSVVTIYSVGSMLVAYSWGFVLQIASTVFPPIQRAAATNMLEEVRWLYLRQARLAMLLGLPLYLGFIFFGRSFITLWMGQTFLEAVPVLSLLSVARIISLFSFGMGSTVNAMGYVKSVTAISVAEAAANLGLAVVFTVWLGWGLTGIAAAAIVATSLTTAIPLPVYACYRLRLGGAIYLRDLVLPGVLAAGLTAGCFAFIEAVSRTDSWPTFFVTVSIAAVCGLGIGSAFLLLPNDRRRVMRLFGFARACP